MTPIETLLAIMARLRSADGCPWDRAQSFASIAPYTIEEAYEVADAIERNDLKDLKDELGDLLFQVVFHAEMAREAGQFDFDDVARGIVEKLVRRHPHVFGGAPVPTAQSAAWEESKALERATRPAAAGEAPSALDGVPRALPALMRAFKLSKRAARAGFDWDHPSQTADKVAEELAEVRTAAGAVGAGGAALTTGEALIEGVLGREAIAEEMGDLLFAAANLARKLGVDAEAALRAANAKFERRFRAMEALARDRGLDFDRLPLEAQERLWLEVKEGE